MSTLPGRRTGPCAILLFVLTGAVCVAEAQTTPFIDRFTSDHPSRSATSAIVPIVVDHAEPAQPTTVIFTPSVDHATKVVAYVMELRRASDPTTAAPLATGNLGKPAIVGGEISADITSMVDALPSGSYYGVVVAVGLSGSTPSAPSPPFSTSSTASYALTPSALTLAAGASLSVTWSAPAGSPTADWIALYRVGDPNGSYLWWRYTGGTASGTATLTAPSQAGTYEFRYLLSGGFTDVARSAAITVTSGSGGGGGGGGGGGSTYSLTASASTVLPGEQFSVAWTAPAGSAIYDWIALYKQGDPNVSYLWWRYTGGTTSGSATVTAPDTAGNYEFRYLLNSGYTDAARSSVVSVSTSGGGGGGGGGGGSGGTYSLTPSASTANAGAPLSIAWTAPSGSSPNDWVALYRVGDPNNSYRWWSYTGGTTSGSATLTAPAEAGTYEFRYLLNGGFTDAARSAPVTIGAGYSLTSSVTSIGVGALFTVSWTAPNGRPTTDWIALYGTGAASPSYLWWIYTGGAASGSVTLVAPWVPGTYEFRYLLDNGYTEGVRSATFAVTSGLDVRLALPSEVLRLAHRADRADPQPAITDPRMAFVLDVRRMREPSPNAER